MSRLISIALSLLVTALWSSAPACGVDLSPKTFRDAQLHDVFMLDPQLVWAVGDRGTILHSADGGQTWTQQKAPFDGRLTSVHFVSPKLGWAVGGSTRPHTLGSIGVVLATRDGGQSWQQLPVRNLPALQRVRFFDPASGVAVGRATSMQASGVLVTEDGGRTWQGVPGGRGWSWQAGDFVDPFTGAVAGRGLWAGVDRRAVRMPAGEQSRIRAVRDLRLVPPVGGWAAGDGGLVLTTSDLGRTWFESSASLPEFATRHFDLNAIAVVGEDVIAAGAPGSRVFHSPDAGHTWQAIPTGLSTPLAALHFAEDRHGVAVGALGAILTTHDGGQSWRVSREGHRRAPLLAIAAREDALPVEALAHASATDGYLSTSLVLFRDPPEDVASVPSARAVVSRAGDDVESRIHEATVRAGGAASRRAWRFPARRPRLPNGASNEVNAPHRGVRFGETDLLAELNRQTDGRALAQLEALLVREIRMWRPDVVVVGVSPERPTAEDRLTEQLVLTAIQAAAEPTRHIDLATEADLPAWQVKRAFVGSVRQTEPDAGHMPSLPTTSSPQHQSDHSAEVRIGKTDLLVPLSALVPQLGGTVGEIADRARSLLGGDARYATVSAALRQVHPPGAPPKRLRHIFEGIDLPPGGDGRRAAVPLTDELVQQAADEAERRRNVRAIVANQPGNAALASHVSTFTQGMSDAAKARVLHQLASGYRDAGNYRLAAQVFERLVREHPQDESVDAALVWLVQYHAGSETQWGDHRRDADRIVAKAAETDKAVEIGRLAAELRPQLVLEPPVGVPLAAANRRAGLVNEADRYMLLVRQRGADDAWQQLAQAERWLATPTQEPPTLPIWTCRRTNQRPHLDGVLDEAFWQATRPAVVELKSQMTDDKSQINLNQQRTKSNRAEIRLVYDHQFLYLGAQVWAPRSGAVRQSASNRERDADLANEDRLHIALDVDRDLCTFYELAVSESGRVHDQAWHDPRWDPQWYVAHAADEHTWTVEAVIPLTALTSAPPQSRDVWCASVSLLSAERLISTWHGPATANPSPASFGLLFFD